MIRSFIVLLLLAVFFLTGMLLGIDRGQNADDTPQEKVEELVVTNTKETKSEIVEVEGPITENVSESAMNVDTPVHFTQKIASFLETGIKWFYEMVVLLVYQIAQLFF